jgi:hypothetical protein
MEEDRELTNLGQAIEAEAQAAASEPARRPNKRFTGRKATDAGKSINGTIEETGAVQGKLNKASHSQCKV